MQRVGDDAEHDPSADPIQMPQSMRNVEFESECSYACFASWPFGTVLEPLLERAQLDCLMANLDQASTFSIASIGSHDRLGSVCGVYASTDDVLSRLPPNVTVSTPSSSQSALVHDRYRPFFIDVGTAHRADMLALSP